MARSVPVLCGSIAGSIGGLGVKMHNSAYRQAGLDYTYVSFEPKSAREAIQAMRALGMRGLGVTMPFKEQVIPFLDELDDTAAAIGAVNTVVNTDGVLRGYNTDWVGAIDGLKRVTELKNKRVCLLGAGGAAKAIAYGLHLYTDQVTVFNVEEEPARELCNKYGYTFGGGIPNGCPETCELLINATSVGFQSRDSILSKEQIPQGIVVLDVVFKPLETTFAQYALQRGCKVVTGFEMMVGQAMGQFELYTGQRADAETMRRAALARLEGNE